MPEDKVKIEDENGKREVALLDVQEILGLHRKEFPIAVMIDGREQALVFKILPRVIQDEINARYKSWLNSYFFEAFAEVQLIKEKKPEDRTLEENEKLGEFRRESWPYLTEVSHAMLTKPEMDLETFREIMDAAGLVGWMRISLHCVGIMKQIITDPKN